MTETNKQPAIFSSIVGMFALFWMLVFLESLIIMQYWRWFGVVAFPKIDPLGYWQSFALCFFTDSLFIGMRVQSHDPERASLVKYLMVLAILEIIGFTAHLILQLAI